MDQAWKATAEETAGAFLLFEDEMGLNKVTPLQEGTRVLCLHTPGGAQAFYDGASEPLAPGEESGAVDFNRIRESGRVNGGIEIIGPPPFPEAQG